MSHHKSSNSLPGWLWFFLVLPITLIVALLYKRQRLPAILQQQLAELERAARPPLRYLEPDSIPLDMSDVHPPAAPFQSAEERTSEPAASQPAEVSDDLKVIEGIGPAIARLLNEQGVRSFRDLAAMPAARLEEILTEARLNRLSDPSTWPEQARLAAEGSWEALNKLQSSLKGGRRKN